MRKHTLSAPLRGNRPGLVWPNFAGRHGQWLALGSVALGAALASCSQLEGPAGPPRPRPALTAEVVTLGTLEAVPGEMDASNAAGWWSPFDEFGGNTYFAYNAPGSSAGTHTVRVARRTAGGTWTSACVQNGGTCASYTDDIGHNQPSLAVDGDGYLHAFVSMHNNPWRYYRSDQPGDVTTMTNHASEMADGGESFTYPVITRAPSGDLYLIARAGSDRSGRLYRWNNAANTWTRLAIFANNSGYAVYPDDIQADPDGNLHILYEWHQGNAGPTRHLASYLKYNPATNTATKASGAALALPATLSTSDVYQPFEGSEHWTADGDNTSAGVQNAKLALVPNSTSLSVAYRYREVDNGPYTVRRAYHNGGPWALTTVYEAGDTNPAIGTTHSGSTGTVRIYYAKKGAANTATVAEKTGSGSFVESPVAAGKSIERLAVKKRGDGTDVLYLSAPTETSASGGKLYFRPVAR